MKTYVQAQIFKIFQSIVDGYKEPFIPTKNENGRKLSLNNSKAKNAILNGLVDSVYVKVMNCISTKYIWEKLHNVYEVDTKFKEAKLQTYRGQFEQLKMKEDENIAAYFLRDDETMNAIRGLGEEVDEYIIVQKVLRSLPMRFDPKISVLEERIDMYSIRMDELHGIFTAYEMIIEQENLVKKEEKFKAYKKSKQKEKSDSNNSDISEDYEEVANFLRTLKKGTNGKYRGKIALICFNCDGIGHLSNKLPHKKKKKNEEDNSNRKKKYTQGK
jgi:hypothetical protein